MITPIHSARAEFLIIADYSKWVWLPHFPGRVHVGVAKNSGLPVYATICWGDVIYHRAVWTDSGWKFVGIPLSRIRLSFDVLTRLLSGNVPERDD